ncbi:putative clathrin assembly protein At4g40080 [Neltuma alba]|uniref:putative clathrin assembly protein At4g40080 n=1 Tax=Neltuma alba TaxID=207710 RepID=UPI0010A3A51E|nr:putative clathrin assembly protein At4g40080 [Prosopis alba]
MAPKERVRNLIYNLKDKASIVAATLSLKRHVSSVRLHVLRATNHSISYPPSEDRIAAVLSVSQGSHLLPRVCIDALMDRLHETRNAIVALKCLFMLHTIVRGPLALRDQLSYYPSFGGHNFLNLSNFRDDSGPESLELTSWVRWYAGVLEQSLTVSRVLGYHLTSGDNNNQKNGVQERKHLRGSNSDLLREIESLVGFVEQLTRVPESLYLQKNELVYEAVRLAGEDYRSVQSEIFLRVEEFGERMEILDVGELSGLVGYLTRIEGSKEKLVLLFVNRIRNDAFWDLINQARRKMQAKKEEMEGKWLTARPKSIGWANPFLEADQRIAIPPGGGWVRKIRNGVL